jgi:hypothetical protein
MVDDTQPVPESTVSVCPWCSANYSGDPDTCPSCGAALAVDPATDPALPGLTAIDAAAIVRAKAPVARPRNRLLSWISGDYPDDTPSVTEAGALAPPALDVRREMLRLELEAEVANLQAEADALLAEAGIEGGAPNVTSPPAAATAVAVEGEESTEGGEADVADETEPRSDEGRQAV